MNEKRETDSQHTLEDRRKRGWFWADNVILDIYGPDLGPYALAIYFALCRHADLSEGRVSFPSYQTLAGETGMSERSAKRAVKCLIEKGLVNKERRRKEGDKTFTSNLYTLVPLSSEAKCPTDTPVVSQGHLGGVCEAQEGIPILRKTQEKEGAPPSSQKEATPSCSEDGSLKKAMAMLRERCSNRGYKLERSLASRDGKDLKAMLAEGYSLSDIFTCYDSKLSEARFRDRHLPMAFVREDIGAFLGTKEKLVCPECGGEPRYCDCDDRGAPIPESEYRKREEERELAEWQRKQEEEARLAVQEYRKDEKYCRESAAHLKAMMEFTGKRMDEIGLDQIKGYKAHLYEKAKHTFGCLTYIKTCVEYDWLSLREEFEAWLPR